MRIAIVFFSLILATFSSLQNAWGARLNLGLIHTQANQDADLVLSEVPRNMSDASDEITIRWTPDNIRGTLRYSTSFNGEEPDGYQNVVQDPIASSPGLIRIRGRSLPVGYFYCIIDGGNAGYSVVFNIIRVADSAPSMVAPITGAGRQGINTITPTLRWEAINGVPFYHVIVSDQPFEITEDEDGTRVEGANVVWQAITSETSIQYGIPDPSEFFDNDQTAPLIGSLDRGDRPRYAWVVLNNYGNQPAYTSTVTGGVAGFEVEVAPPFDEPENISPQTRTSLNSNEILFRWTEVEEAVSYFVYVSKEEISQGGSRALVPAWNAQTTFSSIACPAAEILPSGRFVWKVLAASRQGRGTMSDTSSFIYDVSSGAITTTSRTIDGAILEYVQIDVESIDGPGVLSFATDDQGYSYRQIPVGTYIFHGVKSGYNDTASARITIRQGEENSLSLRLRALVSSVVGTTVDENGDPVSRAVVTARRVPGGDETTAETNVSGEYQIVLPPGNYLINAVAPNRRPAEEFSVNLPRAATIDLDADNGPIVLESYTYTISGYVRNGNGQPINSATVIAVSPNGDERRFYTPEAGSFSFNAGQGLWRLNAVKPGFYLESGEVQVPVNDRNLEVNFTLLPQAGIFSGQVIIDGAPANRNADVWFVPSAGQITTTTVSQVGAFSRGVSPGDYVAFAVREGYHTTDSLRLSVDPGETISGLRLVLEANASSISGRITDGGGNALRNANVQASGVSVASDANGNYTLRVAAGSHTVVATKAGFVTAQRGPVSVSAGQDIQNIDIRLVDNAGTISGIVRRGNDPIFDAVVTATNQGQGGARYTARTARDGSYSFGLAFGSYRLTVQKEGFVAAAPGYIDVQLQAGQNVNGRDFPMLTYSGRVVGNVSSPAGAVNTPFIRITQLDDPNRVYNSNGNVQGDYALAITPERRYIVTTTKAGYNSVSDTTGVLGIEGEIVVNQRLTPLPASIAGVVTSDGAALSGAAVRAEGQAGAFETATDRQGRFLVSLQPGQYRVTASKAGYTAAERNQQVNAGENVAAVDFALQANFALISGLVRDPDGTGISGASVSVIDSINQRSRTTQTDRDGAYQLDQIIPGNYHLIVTSDRYRRSTRNLGAVLGRQERRGENLELSPLAARITGQVTASGAPVASATVYATDEEGNQFTASTDNNGRYAINNMSDGVFDLLPTKSGYTGTARNDVDVNPADSLVADLELVLNNGRIIGVVRDPDGVGLRNVRVSAIDSLGHFAAATTNAAGQYSLDNLYPPTRYRLSPLLSGYTPEQDTIRNIANGADVAIRMFPNELRITGQVVNQIGQGIGSTEMIATSQTDGSVYRATANQIGSFTFTGLAANSRYRLQTQRNEEFYANADTTVQIVANHLDIGARVRIIERRASVRGRVTSNNVGVPDVQITTRNIYTGRQRSTYTAGDGNYRVLGMRGGDLDDYIVRANKSGYVFRGSDSLRIDNLTIAETRSGIDFVADAILIDISGRVIDSLGVAVPNVSVVAWSESGQTRGTTDGNGAFSIVDLYPNHRYSLSTELPREGYENATTAFDIALRDTSGIILTIGRHNATISGLMTNDQGAPIKGAALLDGMIQVTANDTGFYRFEYVSPGVHSLTFFKSGFLTLESEIDAGNGEGEYTRNAVLTALDRAIFGTIKDVTNRVAVPGVVIRLISNAADTLYDTTTANGAFQFNNLDPLKTYSMRTAKKGYGVFTRTGLSVAENNVEVNERIALPARGIYGRLTDSQGLAISQAVIKVRSFNNQIINDTTDFFGDYFAIVDPGTYAVIGYARTPGAGNSRNINVAVVSGAGSRINLTVEPTGRAEGVLRLEDGTPPLTTARITASHNATGDLYFTVASNDGSFILEGLRSGGYTLSADAAGYAMQISPFLFDARLGEITAITIPMTQSGKAIFGFVLDDQGDGVQRARVTLTGNSPGLFETDGKGYWSQPGPLAGRYTVAVIRNGYAQPADTTFDLAAGGISQIDRTITPIPMTLSGRLVGVNGNPYANGMIYLLTNNRPIDSVATDSYGEYSFTSLNPVSYSLRAQISGYTGVPATRTVDLAVLSYGLNQDFNLTAVRGFGIVHGNVRHDGDPVSTQVTVVDLQTGSRFGVTSAQDGTYRITQIPTPSTFKLTAVYPDAPDLSTSSFLLQTNEDQTRDLTFPAGQIRVTLLNAEGNPVVGRRVFVSGIDLNYSSILYSDGQGRASTVQWLPAGDYSVTPEALSGMLPPSPKIVRLGVDEISEITWFLGWRFTPPPPFSFEDSARVSIAVPGGVSIADADLFFKGPGASGFSSVPLQREASGRSPGRGVRSVVDELPVISGFDETVTYYGYIPPQGRSGTLSYYLQVVTADGFIFGGIESAQDVTISARGLLDRIEIVRTQSALLPRVGVPFRISVSVFDDGNNDLTAHLREEGVFEWFEIGESLGRLEIDAVDSSQATYYPEAVGRAEIRSRVTQPSADVAIAKSLQWDNIVTTVASLNIASSQHILKAGDSLRFTVTAIDTSGALVPVSPTWKTTPVELATAVPVPYSMDAWLKTTPGVIGKVQITAEDTLSDISTNYNDDSPDRSQHGLAIFAELRSGGADTTTLTDGEGFEIKIPPSAFTTNATARIFLNEPNLSPVFRLTTKYELAAFGYNITVDGNISQNGQYLLTFPVPMEYRLKTPTVGVWNSKVIDWDVIEGQFNVDSTEVQVEVSSLAGLYALISSSEALGVRDLKFLPNPFSPQATTPGLSIEFRLTSDMSDRPNLSVMIYNMQGQIVRKLIDSRQFPKGDYRRGGENELIWDGMTDDNLPARNGRYIIVLIARDASGESKEVGSAVLVK